MIKELSALCTKRSASFFVFHTKQAEKSEHKEMDPRGDSRQPRIASSCENRVEGGLVNAHGLSMRRNGEIIGKWKWIWMQALTDYWG